MKSGYDAQMICTLMSKVRQLLEQEIRRSCRSGACGRSNCGVISCHFVVHTQLTTLYSTWMPSSTAEPTHADHAAVIVKIRDVDPRLVSYNSIQYVHAVLGR